jgi:hypothetical protein
VGRWRRINDRLTGAARGQANRDGNAVSIARPRSGLDPRSNPRRNKLREPMAQSTFAHHRQSCRATAGSRTLCSQFRHKKATANSDGWMPYFPSQQGRNPSNAPTPWIQLDGVSAAPLCETACTSGDHGSGRHRSSAGHRFRSARTQLSPAWQVPSGLSGDRRLWLSSADGG